MQKIDDIHFETIKKLTKTNFKFKELQKISKINSISPPSVFIGSKLKYPLVNVGILSPLEKDENAWVYDDAKYWADKNFSINDVVQLRNNLLNSRFQSKVKDTQLNKKFLDIAQNIAISFNPIDIEIELKNKLNFKRKTDKIAVFQGLNAPLQKAKIIGNVKVHKKVDKIVNDELKASQGLEFLYKNNIDEYSLSKILSVGVLGLKKNKKLVPTRWSITATDDTLGKSLLKQIKDYKWIEDYELFFGEFMGNQYLIMLFPHFFSYELFEIYFPGSSWNPSNELKASTDYEGYSGRKNYAFATAGGYYATRLPILEYLNKIKKQASILVIRLETPSYWASLGVWVCREACRKTLRTKSLKINSKEELINLSINFSKKRFNFDPSFLFPKSKLIKNLTQKKITEFF